METDPRVDAYFAKAADFARPIVEHLRALLHATVPEAEETIKWGMPHFVYRGKNLAGIGVFKAHVAFVLHGQGRQGAESRDGMGQYGKLTSLADLPADEELRARIAFGKGEIDNPVRPVRKKSAPRPELPVPEDFACALAANPAAKATLDAFAPSHRREYVEWIIEAKRAETREKRIAQAVTQLAEGKKRNWKYENC